jgi:hypothetical protein
LRQSIEEVDAPALRVFYASRLAIRSPLPSLLKFYQHSDCRFEDLPPPDLVQVLLQRFVASVPISMHLSALEACAEARVQNELLQGTLLDSTDVRELFKWLVVGEPIALPGLLGLPVDGPTANWY